MRTFAILCPFLEVAETTEGMVVGTYLLRENIQEILFYASPMNGPQPFRGEVMGEFLLC